MRTERQENEVVLRALILVDGRDLRGHPEQRVAAAAVHEHVVQQVLLPVVRREHCDALGRVAQNAHVRVHRRDVLCFAEVLATS